MDPSRAPESKGNGMSEQGWHFECPVCGFDDAEHGRLATDAQIYCGECAGDNGRDVLLKRWKDVERRSGDDDLRAKLAERIAVMLADGRTAQEIADYVMKEISGA